MAKFIFVMVLVVSVLAITLQSTREDPRYADHNDLTLKEMYQTCMRATETVTLEELILLFGEPRPPRGMFQSFDQMDFRIFSPPEYAIEYGDDVIATLDIDTKKVLELRCSKKHTAW